jgi:hypothetical protein
MGDSGGEMRDHDKPHSSFTGGISAAESRGITNKKGGIMARRHKKVGRKHGRKRGHKK